MVLFESTDLVFVNDEFNIVSLSYALILVDVLLLCYSCVLDAKNLPHCLTLPPEASGAF